MADPASLSLLDTPYHFKPGQKGGTVIQEGVTGLEQHEKLLVDPDGYRPSDCPGCGHARLHAHAFRWRRNRGDAELTFLQIRCYWCPRCSAVWRVLPGFLARHLQRRWAVVQAAMVKGGPLSPSGEEVRVRIPRSTLARWRCRLATAARVVLQGLAGLGAEVGGVLKGLGMDATRAELVEALVVAGAIDAGSKLAQLAGFIHRVLPGVRLM